MSSKYVLKDKKIKVYRYSNSQNAMGVWVKAYKYIVNGSLWAYARQLSQEQTLAAAQYGDSEKRLFVVNYRNDLQLGDFIEYNGRHYSITRLDTTDDYNGDLYIYVNDVALGDVPKNILPA